MKKRIIYGIGSTSSSVVSAFKALNDPQFNAETIYKIWDVDAATRNIENLNPEEIKIFTETNIRETIKAIKDDKHNNEEIYSELEDVFPMNDDELINNIPITNAQGSAKKPIISRLISQIYLDRIKQSVNTDCIDVRQRPIEAYVILSTCGGTSTGLNVEIIAELLRNNCTLYLFFLSPGYFFRVDNTDDFKSNTVATLLRIFHDLEKKEIFYVTPSVNFNSMVYPFIIESEWQEGVFAEYSNFSPNRVDRDLFVKYNATVLKAFFLQNEKPQNFSSRINNELTTIADQKEFFNLILLYPNNKYQENFVKKIKREVYQTNEKSGKDNLFAVLSQIQTGMILNGVDPFLLRNPEKTKEKLAEEVSLSIFDRNKIYTYVRDYYDTNLSVWQKNEEAKNKDTNLADIMSLEDEARSRKKNMFQRIWDYINYKEDEEVDVENKIDTSAINSAEISNLKDWCTVAIKNFNLNKDFIDSLSSQLLEGSEDEAVKLRSFSNQKIFENPNYLTDYLNRQVAENSSEMDTDLPPALLRTADPLVTYTGNMLIEGKNYYLKIYSKIPDHDIKYMRGEFLDIYKHSKNAMKWCFPDKRLQGIRPFDGKAEIFKKWHDATVKTLGNNNETENPTYSEESAKVLLCALAFISDRLNQNDPGFDPIVDFKKTPSGNAYYMVWKKDATTSLTGDATQDILFVVKSFFKKIMPPSSDTSLFPKIGSSTSISDICASSKKQIFNYAGDKNKLKESFNMAYETVQEYKKQFLFLNNKEVATILRTELEKREQFINEIIATIGALAEELKDKLKSDELLPGVPNIK